jgi:hypothetical protein
MAISVYAAVFESINAKKKYDIIFLVQRCNACLVYYNDKCQFNVLQWHNFMPICHSEIQFH